MTVFPCVLIFHSSSVILEAVQEKFPDYKKSYFGIAINNFLTNLRRKNKVADDGVATNVIIIQKSFY